MRTCVCAHLPKFNAAILQGQSLEIRREAEATREVLGCENGEGTFTDHSLCAWHQDKCFIRYFVNP